MADIDFFQDNQDDSQEDGGEGEEDGANDDDAILADYEDPPHPDDCLTPLQKLEKYMDSENIFSRQMVARSILDTLRAMGDSVENSNSVLQCMVKMSEDPEPTVRVELMEQVPHIAMYCHDNKQLFQESAIPSYILPLITKYLTDANTQVRKTSQAALLVLLEQEILKTCDVEEQVCPVILRLSEQDSMDDYRTEAVALMSKMAPLVGCDVTTRLFLPRFSHMCGDALFHVRKVCAANFGDMCTVVGSESTQDILLDKFFLLCEDGVWGVRKACAECFTAVSLACNQGIRHKDLAHIFISLISDQSRWVRMAGFQALGGFISTFADPNSTGLFFNEEGNLCVGDQNVHSEELEEKALSLLEKDRQHSNNIKEVPPETSGDDDTNQSNVDNNTTNTNQNTDTVTTTMTQQDSDQSSINNNTESMQIDCDDIKNDDDEERTSNNNSETLSFEEKRADVYKSKTSENLEIKNIDDFHIEQSNDVDNGNAPSNTDPSTDKDTADMVKNTNNTNTAYNEFFYWRAPLPEVDLDLEIGQGDRGQAIKSSNESSTLQTENDIAGICKSLAETKLDDSETSTKDTSNDQKESEIKSNETEPSPESKCNSESSQSESVESSETAENSESVENSPDIECGIEKPIEMDLDDEDLDTPMHTASVHTVSEQPEMVTNIGSTHVLGHQLNETTLDIVTGVVQDMEGSVSNVKSALEGLSELQDSEESPQDDKEVSRDQDVIPQPLLDHYLSMTDPTRAQTVDTEIAKHCAYSFPAVAYTLGRRNWKCLKECYDILAGDMQWKVRRTLAFSMHELAVIVGPGITERDLVPIFNSFMKDLDEVRTGILKHLADFIRLLSPELRLLYLEQISSFLTTDNHRNWRFRLDLAEQLVLLCELFSSEQISEHLVPVAMCLADDRVSEVRNMAFKVLSMMMKRLNMSGESNTDLNLAKQFTDDIIKKFANQNKWNKRQIYAQLCRSMLTAHAVTPQQFAKDLQPALLNLGLDPTPNVRLSVAKTLSQGLLPMDYFTSPQSPLHSQLLETVQKLQGDPDRDVRYFVALPPQTDLGEAVSGGSIDIESESEMTY
ncbi:unnamed protein product [Owenia fusiformis]|uniref:Phosphatase 2A Regulatory Subunit A helical domain-containing protein n=1 Tax=Owenia fusiformis TaxID=6347 RepID=A0A8S4NE31_OWEFU|nr:unnamed protein product [Owenia fusiformis]